MSVENKLKIFREENNIIVNNWLDGVINDKYFIQLLNSRVTLRRVVLK